MRIWRPMSGLTGQRTPASQTTLHTIRPRVQRHTPCSMVFGEGGFAITAGEGRGGCPTGTHCLCQGGWMHWLGGGLQDRARVHQPCGTALLLGGP